MENSRFRQESHVAQQSRRDKLRVVQQSSTTCSSVQQQDHLPNNLEHLSVHSGENPGLVQVRNVRNGNNLLYEPTSTTTTSISTVFSSELLNFATSSCNKVSSAHQRNAILDQEIGASSFTNNMSGPISSNFNASSHKVSTSTDPHGCSSSSNWRSIDSQQSYDWMVNYASGLSVGRESNQKPMFVGDVLSNNARVTDISTSTSTAEYLRPSFNGYQDFQSCMPNPNNEIPSNFHHNHHHHQLYNQNPLQVQDVVVSPAPSAIYFENVNSWMNNNTNTSELGLIARKTDQELKNININVSDPNTHQGLSLSLSSNPPSRANVIQFGSDDSKFVKSSNYFCPVPKPGIMISRECGKSNSDSVVGGSSNFVTRNVGPLGPFTGYATILKSSRFLKPAQELLDEFCIVTSSKQLIIRTYGETSDLASDDGVNVVDTEAGSKENNIGNNNTNNSGISSSTFYSSNEVSGDVAVATSSCESYRPEYQQKKAKLLYLQEEVCRRYKQYQQQMQMVASSFESVAGLSAATPYVSLALKTVSRNFRCLKHVISDQLRHVTRALGEDLLSPNTGASSSKGDTSTSRMRYMDQSLQRHKSGGANVGFFEPQQHVWRPQRGLPERSVAILRAWLFEHFLHPYPTDTDKHMLATQTGLSRNQVSNWFINARVRVWKPMVEEIHMLETKGIAEMNRNCANLDGKSADHGGTSQPNREQPSNNLGANSMLSKQQQQLECSSSAGSEEQVNAEQWNQEKRSRVDFQVPTGMDGSVMNFLPYQRSGIDIGGLGAVSLTLGLRHSVENAQHQQQQQQQQQQHTQLHQQHEDQLRRQFGGQMIHDFVG